MLHRSVTGRLLLFMVVLAGCSCQGNHAREEEGFTSILNPVDLQSYGFKQSATDRDFFTLEHTRLADVAIKMGFSPEYVQLMPKEAGPTDSRAVMAWGVYIVFTSETHDRNGEIVADSLDNPQAICTVRVSFARKHIRGYLEADAHPSLRIKSAIQSPTTPSQLQITFEIAATGSTPVTVPQDEFWFGLAGPGSPAACSNPVSFPSGTSQPVIVLPGKPLTLTVNASTDQYPNEVLRHLPGGSYTLHVSINGNKGTQDFDYHMYSPIRSDNYNIVLR